MGVKLMTGATGEQNIQAADDRECLAGITGLDSYVFPTGSQLKATLVDANTVTIGTGAGSLQGSRFRCSTTTTVNIQSGTQGQYRRDIVGLHFSRETSGREGLEFQVLTGDPASSEGAAADPAYTAGDLLKGDAEAFMPLYRVKLSGINAADPEPMFSVLTPLATIGDSVSMRDNVLYYGPWPVGGTIVVPGFSKYKIFTFNVLNWGDPNLIAIPKTNTFNASAVDCWDTNSAGTLAVCAMRIRRDNDNLTLLSAGRVCVANNYAYPYGGNVRIVGVI